MNQEELNCYIRGFASDHGVSPEQCTPIAKKDLVVGKTYQGECRNASEAVWDGRQFMYRRYKWGTTYTENINHYEDDDGYDVFVPIEISII